MEAPTSTSTSSTTTSSGKETYDQITSQVEKSWYKKWEDKKLFVPKLRNPKGKNYSLMIPPPNVTGTLHIGHALTNSIQDALIRHQRMLGNRVLWLPGTDHAGIATQVVVEKNIARERNDPNFSFHQMKRADFINKCWEWTSSKGGTIKEQTKRMGCSVDWDREVFTLDDKCSHAVKHAFCKMFNDKMIYRENRIVHWDCHLKTAVSTIELDTIELTQPTPLKIPDYEEKIVFGEITTFSYPLKSPSEDGPKFIQVATTRLETMLGDTAIAVNPTDPKKMHLIGQFVVHPFSGREIPIIGDEYAKAEFGTGAVKITPAHDPNDFMVGQRRNLPFLDIFDDTGKILEKSSSGVPVGINIVGEDFTGLPRYTARAKIAAELEKLGLLGETVPNPMSLKICGRSGDVVEPRVKPQWYVKCDSIAKRAAKSARPTLDSEGQVLKPAELQFYPKEYTSTFLQWMDNLHDWCISRQLWWGHRIPAYCIQTKLESGQWQIVHDSKGDELWVAAIDEQSAKAQLSDAIKNIPSTVEYRIYQDEDVLDTWFSSGIFPFSTLGWPEKTPDLNDFYPNSISETGHDIIFFWVSRMVLMGLYLTDKLPFKTVFLHPMVRDAKGRKMSKSRGNVIDPVFFINGCELKDLINVIEESNLSKQEMSESIQDMKQNYPNGIEACGADALRFGLCNYMKQGGSINLNPQVILSFKYFCNKLFNVSKFAISYLYPESGPRFKAKPKFSISGNESFLDTWILNQLYEVIGEVNISFSTYNLYRGTNAVYRFWWDKFCSIYIESIKPVLWGEDENARQSTLSVVYFIIENGLKLLHPYMPFISEELYQKLDRRPGDTCESIVISQFPLCENFEFLKKPETVSQFDLVFDAILKIRSLRAKYGIFPNQLDEEGNVKEIPTISVVPTPREGQDQTTREKMNAEISVLNLHSNLILTLSKLPLKFLSAKSDIKGQTVSFTAGTDIEFHVPGRFCDFTKEIKRVEKAIKVTTKTRDSLDKRLNPPPAKPNPKKKNKKPRKSFRESAPPHILADTIKQLADAESMLITLNKSLDHLKALSASESS